MTNRSARTWIGIASLGITFQYANAKICEYTLNRCMSEPNAFKSFRTNDLERLSKLVGKLSFTSETGIEITVGKAILRELRNYADQIINIGFHQQFIYIQWNLTTKDIYDLELLENTLRKDYVLRMYGRRTQLVIPMYSLDTYARLNLATIYKGDLLSDVHLEKMGKFLTDYLPKDRIKTKRGGGAHSEVSKCVENLFEHFTYAHAVSHFRQENIFVGIDKTTGKAVDVSHLFPPPYSGQLIWARQIVGENPNLEVYAFVSESFRPFDDETGEPTGAIKQRLQQLNLLGFHTVFVSTIRLRNRQFCDCHFFFSQHLFTDFASGMVSEKRRRTHRFCSSKISRKISRGSIS